MSSNKKNRLEAQRAEGAERKLALKLALRGGRHLLVRAEETTQGIRFRAAEAAIVAGEPAYPADLYDGAAGIALALHDFHAATRDPRWLSLAERVFDGLRESAPVHMGGQQAGLYLGFGGMLLLHVRRAVRLRDRGAVEEATRFAARLREAPLLVCDLLYGAAGTGLAHLALYHATGDPGALAEVRRCLKFLKAKAIPWGGGLAWPAGTPGGKAPKGGEPDGRLATGMAHGTAGVAVFLLKASVALPDSTLVCKLCAQAFRFLDHMSIRNGDTVAWPNSDRSRLVRFHWCQGTAGIAQAFLEHFRHTRDERSLETARAAGLHTWRAMGGEDGKWVDRYACHCHGLSGAIELFVDLYEHGAGQEWWDRAAAAGHRIREISGAGSGPSPLGGDGCGLGYGTAGIVRALLRLAGHAAPAPWVMDGGLIAPPRSKTPAQTKSLPADCPKAAKRIPESPLWPAAAFVPRVAAQIHGSGMLALLGSEWDKEARRFARRFLGSARSEPLHRAALILEKRLRGLRSRYSHFLAPQTLELVSHSHFLRRIAGLALQGGANLTGHRSKVAERLALGYGSMFSRCIERVSADMSGALAGTVAGRTLECEPMGNDPHRGGEVAVALAFEDGPPLIYKPRPVHLDWFLAGGNRTEAGGSAAELINRWLPARIQGARLPTHDLIAAGTWHGYAERVHTHMVPMSRRNTDRFERPGLGRPAPELATRIARGDDQRFWYSAGLLCGQVACFGIGDLHMENIVCGVTRSSPRPAFHAVDLEMAFLKEGGIGNAHLTPIFGSSIAPPAHSHYGLQARPSRYCSMGAEDWALEWTGQGLCPVDEPGRVASRAIANTVENEDGSFGYERHLCAVLRGLADHWETVRAHAGTLKSAVREGLSGCRVRVLSKASITYMAPLRRRQLGTRLWDGAADFQGFGEAAPFGEAEQKQLDAFDVPYFSRSLGSQTVEWLSNGRLRPADSLPYTVLRQPFWSVIDHYTKVSQLAHAIADLVAYVAPKGKFDLRDDALGIRVVRENAEAQIMVVIVTREASLTFRLESGGLIRWWRR